jgi:hypothetical protein
MPHDLSGTPYEVIKRKVEEEVIRPRRVKFSIDRDLEWLLLKALAREAAERYRSVTDFGQDIEHYLAGEPLSAKRGDTFYFFCKRLRRYRRFALTAVVALGGTAGALFAMDYFLREFAAMKEMIVYTSEADLRMIEERHETRKRTQQARRARREKEAQAAYRNLEGAVQARNWVLAANELDRLEREYGDTDQYQNHREQIDDWKRHIPGQPYLRFMPPGGRYRPEAGRR